MKTFYSLIFLTLLLSEPVFSSLFSMFSSSSDDHAYYDEEEEPPSLAAEKNLTDRNIVEISEDVFKSLSSVSDLDSLQLMLGIPNEEPIAPVSTWREDPDLRLMKSDRYLANPKQAHCEPEIKPVDLGLTNTHEVTYYPTCVRVKQCGGCCPKKDRFSCQSIASKKVVVKVLVLKAQKSKNEVRRPSRLRERRGRRNAPRYEYNSINVTVEEHTDCRCMCRVQEHDCNPRLHIHSDQSCECICKNADEEKKCLQQNTHIWDKNTCQCLCRKTFECSSSKQFDHKTCGCVKILKIDYGDMFYRSGSSGTRIRTRARKPVAVTPFLEVSEGRPERIS